MERITDARVCTCGIGNLHYGQFGIYIACVDVVRYWAVRNVVCTPRKDLRGGILGVTGLTAQTVTHLAGST